MLATASDVSVALGRALTTAEAGTVDGLLDEASDLVLGYLDVAQEDLAPTPGAVVRVVARMVARVLRRGDVDAESADATQVGQTSGPFSRQFTLAAGSTSGSPWIDAADKMKLRRYRVGMQSAALSGDHTGHYRRLS